MPFSSSTFDAQIEIYFQDSEHETVLDIGPGEGKFGRMLRRIGSAAKRIAVEVDPSYVERFGLREVYDEVFIMDAARLMDHVGWRFGAVIVGDVIEHLRKSVGTDLLNFLIYRANVIFVKFPVQLLQDDWEGHASEAHVSVWSEHDFAGFDHVFVKGDPMQLAVLRGYRNAAIEWLPRRFIRALGYDSCTAYYNERPDRWRFAPSPILLWRQAGDATLRSLINPGEKFIMIDEEKSGLLTEAAAFRIPFLERNGQYYGMPANDDDALAELERQRSAGAKWVVIAQYSFWVEEAYPRLMDELNTSHPCRLRSSALLVFELR